MENRVLRNFMEIAREQSITVAANKLHVSQSALSRQMINLEEELGQKLFTRHRHHVSLTKDGQYLLERAQQIIELEDSTLRYFEKKSSNLTGEIYVAEAEFSSMKEIVATLKEFHDEHPGVCIHIYTGAAEGLAKRMDQGIIDFAFFLTPTDYLIRYNTLQTGLREEMGLVLPKDSPLAQKEVIHPEDLYDQPLIISRQVQNARNQNAVRDWLGRDFYELNVVSTYNLPYNVGMAVEAGLGYCICLKGLIPTGEDSPLCFRPLSPALYSDVIFAWKPDKKLTPAAKVLFEMFRHQYAQK